MADWRTPGKTLAGTNGAGNEDPARSLTPPSKVDDYYARYAREMDPVKRKAISREFPEFMTDKLYWNTIFGSPFYEVAQPWMKDYVYNAE